MRNFRDIPNPIRSQRGDTIVEVMIAVVVIGVVLIGAFTLTNRSTRQMRDSEEHTQANQLLQGQVERLRSVASQMRYTDFPASNYFCFDEDGALTALASATSYGCLQGNFYKFSIERKQPQPAAGNNATFTLAVRWDSVTGNKAFESITYKVGLLP